MSLFINQFNKNKYLRNNNKKNLLFLNQLIYLNMLQELKSLETMNVV